MGNALCLYGTIKGEYFEAYYTSERMLEQIVLAGEEFLLSKGYRTYAQIGERMSSNKQWRSKYAHKTIATCAGIGWLGKSCLLITKEFGSAVRLSSILTDAPIDCAEPICESKCGDCRRCVEACPYTQRYVRGISNEK